MSGSKHPQWAFSPKEGGLREGGMRYGLCDLFKWGADTFGERAAVSDGRVTYNFRELETGAKKVGRLLSDIDVQPGTRVVVLAEKKALMPILAAAIWKVGAVYVPLDSENPAARNTRIIEQIKPSVVMGAKRILSGIAAPCPTVDFGKLERCLADEMTPCLELEVRSDDADAAYVIFTSGSTGEPKGAMISHGSLLDYFSNHNRVLQFTENSRVFSLSPFHFDVSIEDTLLPLSLGAYVYLFRGIPLGPLLRRKLSDERITHLIAVSTLLSIITEDGREIVSEKFPDLQMVMTGAEVCDPKIINIWKNQMPDLRVINAYGPTETTIVCLTHEIVCADPSRRKSYPIGRPLDRVHTKLMGPGEEITAPYTPGELWIGGSQVMLGYLGRPEETRKTIVLLDGVRYYRTGDVCQINDAGEFEFLGRRDSEIKLAGRRIHLSEIREAALQTPNVAGAIVGVVSLDDSPKIALIVIGGEMDGLLDAISIKLNENLPEYMCPKIIARAEINYISSNGKTDENKFMNLLNKAYEKYKKNKYILVSGDKFVPIGA